MEQVPIGIFDSGYGGLSVMKEIVQLLPQYDYIYLGDNARNPYGTRSFETVHRYTLESVKKLFESGCHLIIVACNTSSAKALRTIQQKDLPLIDSGKRVLGVIRPAAERIGTFSKTRKIGILGTPGTVLSGSYPIEIQKFFPDLMIYQEACPMWVPLIENNEYDSPGADYFIQKNLDHLLQMDAGIDTILLGCTHYPLLERKIRQYLPESIELVSQGKIVAASLQDYLQRHPEMECLCSKSGQRLFYTTDDTLIFDSHATVFFGSEISSRHMEI